MLLKKLTLVGFKSFADRTRLEFERGVTVVVGPNGSGKSNIVDALAWVMGSQAPSTLRTQRMEDLVFAGTATRPQLGRAEVTLLLDNAERHLDLTGLGRLLDSRSLLTGPEALGFFLAGGQGQGARAGSSWRAYLAGVLTGGVLSFLLYLSGQGGWVIVIAILVFSIGEILASPRSKEYAGNIAPPNKVGMYMGYFYWCVALGNLFGGLLSGLSYQHFGPQGVDNPDLMWVLFAVLAASTAVMLVFYNRIVLKPAKT